MLQLYYNIIFVMYNYSDQKQLASESNTCPDYWTIKNAINGHCYDTLRMSPNDKDDAVFNRIRAPSDTLPAQLELEDGWNSRNGLHNIYWRGGGW